MRPFWLLWLAVAQGQPLEDAYRALKAKAYAEAVAAFREAVRQEPGRAALRKDLAYTYLKIGEAEEARDQFAEAMRLDPSDSQAALEYAFLAFETRQRAEARRTFDRVRKTGNAVAEKAFQNIDRDMQEGIARWSAAVARSPDNYSAALELARLAEGRDDLVLAVESYERALRIRPAEHSLLIDLARVLRVAGRDAPATAALERAWREGSPRVAETAREMIPSLAAPKQAGPPGAKEMGFRSYNVGYLQDALRYLKAAYEADPSDSAVALKLGWTHNVLGQNAEAVRWFQLARGSPDHAIAAEATKAYRSLRIAKARIRTTAWMFPFYSSRWNDLFGYAQVKTEWRAGKLPVRPYISLRFIGDLRRTSSRPVPEYLSESAFLPGLGVSVSLARGVTVWAEASAAVGYWTANRPASRASADYRGGFAWMRGFGRLLGGERPGAFAETSNDVVFVSRFNNDTIAYSQNRFGYTLPVHAASGLAAQVCWNANITQDARREYWADFVEFGPGLRFRLKSWPPSLVFSAGVLRGVYTRNEGNPRRPNFYDFRVGFWYAISR